MTETKDEKRQEKKEYGNDHVSTNLSALPSDVLKFLWYSSVSVGIWFDELYSWLRMLFSLRLCVCACVRERPC